MSATIVEGRGAAAAFFNFFNSLISFGFFFYKLIFPKTSFSCSPILSSPSLPEPKLLWGAFVAFQSKDPTYPASQVDR